VPINVDLSPWKGTLFGLAFVAEPKPAELAGVEFALLQGFFAKETERVFALVRLHCTRQIENRTILFDRKLSVTDLEMRK
jgi:hypothetical protein